jgi:hypothetical protein
MKYPKECPVISCHGDLFEILDIDRNDLFCRWVMSRDLPMSPYLFKSFWIYIAQNGIRALTPMAKEMLMTARTYAK